MPEALPNSAAVAPAGPPLLQRQRVRELGVRPAKFAAIGAFCAVAQLGLLALFKESTGLGSWSNACAFVISAQLNILLNSAITWSDRGVPGLRTFGARLLQFNGLIAVAAVFNQAIYLLADQFVPYLLAGAIGIAATTLAKYLVADRWIFGRRGAG